MVRMGGCRLGHSAVDAHKLGEDRMQVGHGCSRYPSRYPAAVEATMAGTCKTMW